jgi:hypothetical protein
LIDIDTGGPGTAVARKMTGGRSPEEAKSEFGPALVPRVQLPTLAKPSESVLAAGRIIDPPPEPTEKTTGTPDTGFPAPSVTLT